MDNDFNDVYEAIERTKRRKRKRKGVLDMNLMQIEFAEKSIPLKYIILVRLFAIMIFIMLSLLIMWLISITWNL